MPELPEVETICRQLESVIKGKVITDALSYTDTLRKPVDIAGLKKVTIGRKIRKIVRRAKYIMVYTAQREGVLIHLGMTGSLRICKKDDEVLKHDRVSFQLGKSLHLRLNDIRKFGCVETFLIERDEEFPKQLLNLGPEPLTENFNGEYLFNVLRGKVVPVKNTIMDQRFVVGVGNIYANEALFLAKIKPTRKSSSITRKECDLLVDKIKYILNLAIKWGGTTISDYKDVDGSAGKFVQQLQVYGKAKEQCRICKGKSEIKRTVIQGRSTFFCPKCQK